MGTFIFYAFFITGTVSFLAELLWRVMHWKVKNQDVVINCSVEEKELDAKKIVDSINAALQKNSIK